MASLIDPPNDPPVMKDGWALIELLAQLDRLVDWHYKHRPGHDRPLTLPARFHGFAVQKMLQRVQGVVLQGNLYHYRGMMLRVRTEVNTRWGL